MALISVRMVRFIRASLPTMRSLEPAYKSMPMATCTWASFKMAKNTAMATSSGSTYPARTPKQINLSSTTTDSGGAVYPTALESTSELMVCIYTKHRRPVHRQLQKRPKARLGL